MQEKIDIKSERRKSMEIKIPKRLEEKMGEDLEAECKNVFRKRA